MRTGFRSQPVRRQVQRSYRPAPVTLACRRLPDGCEISCDSESSCYRQRDQPFFPPNLEIVVTTVTQASAAVILAQHLPKFILIFVTNMARNTYNISLR